MFQKAAATHTDEVWVARAGAHNLDMGRRTSRSQGPVAALHLFYNQLPATAAQDGGSLADAGRTHMPGHGGAGMGHADLSQLLGGEEVYRLTPLAQVVHERLVGLHINGTPATGTGKQAGICHGLAHLVVDAGHGLRLMGQAVTHGDHGPDVS